MPYGVVNADQVSRAYTVPLDGVTQAVQHYDQLAIHKQQRQAQLQKNKQAEDFQKAKLLEKMFDGMDIGTGTPYDEVGHNLVAQAKDKVSQFIQANPGAPATELWAVGNNATKGLLSGIDNAKKASLHVDDLTKSTNQEYPHLDQTALKAFYQHQVFRDADGNILSTPNLGYTPNQLQNPQFRAQFLNPEAAQMAVRKELSEGIKPEPYQYEDPENPNVLIKGKARPYYIGKDGQPQIEKISWQQAVEDANNPLQASALQFVGADPKAPTTRYEKREFAGVNDQALTRLKSGPVFNDLLINEVQRLKKDHPDYLKGATDEQVEKLAAHNLVGQYGSRDGEVLPAPDFKIVEHLEKQKHQQFTEQMAIHNMRNSDARLGLAVKNSALQQTKSAATQAAKQQKVLQSVPGLLALAATDTKDLNPAGVAAVQHARAIVENNKTTVNIGGVSRGALNLSSMHGQQLHQPGTKNPVSLKTVDMGGRVGQVVIETPMIYDKINKHWIEDTKNYRMYGNFKPTDNVHHIARNPADVLQQYDPQFKGIKSEHDAEWNAAYPEDDTTIIEEEE